MDINNSPWIKELNRTRPVDPVSENMVTDIVIVGGGIAGISTAFFLLKNTDKKIILIEAGKVAHGATGHNAGQIVSYFERQLSVMAEEFGAEETVQAHLDVESAWELIEEIHKDAKLQAPFYQFTGYAGMSSFDDVIIRAKNAALLKASGIKGEELMIAEGSDIAKRMPEEYKDLYSLIPHKDILALLETTDPQYAAALAWKKGCMNSALFTEEIAGYLLATYADRFQLKEESPMSEVVLSKKDAMLKINDFEVKAKKVVLCTNGFEKFKITNFGGPEIDKNFHHNVQGVVGYMAAYLAERDKSPTAISFIQKSDAYFYLTRRPFEIEKNERHNLISVGGPEMGMEDTAKYSRDDHPYSKDALKEIDGFIHQEYTHSPKGEIDYKYKWHGLMGYTPNGVRLIGEEPRNRALLYNLGCNGIGILPSIYGGRKISQIIAGENLPPSIFDPK